MLLRLSACHSSCKLQHAEAADTSLLPHSRAPHHTTQSTQEILTRALVTPQVMSFNVGYFFIVVLSMGLGHFLFFSQPWHLALARSETCCETATAPHT